MAKASEFEGHRTRNGISSPVTPDGRPGHDPTSTERLRLMYVAGQDPDEPDPNAKPDPVYFEGNEPLPTDLRKPKYANKRVGGYIEEQ